MRLSYAGYSLLLVFAACGGAPPSTAAPDTTQVARRADKPRRAHFDVDIPPHGSGLNAFAEGESGAVASAERHASAWGLAVLQAGGNAVDAAVTVALVLAVTHPSAGNIGGGGFMLIAPAAGQPVALDYRETAPGAATPTMYQDVERAEGDHSLHGALAAGIPGTVAGLAAAHARYGSLPWATLVEPAARLASEGHVLDAAHADSLKYGTKLMRKEGFDDTLALYTHESGRDLEAGERWVQPALGRTLKAIAQDGPRAFYEGPIAEALVAGVRRAGGIWRLEDLQRYEAKWREPINFRYAGHQVWTMPPPSAGGVTLRHILRGTRLVGKELPDGMPSWGTPEAWHLYLEVSKRAYVDRNTLLGDPDFVRNPLSTLLTDDYLAQRMNGVRLDRVTPSEQLGPIIEPAESLETTHFSVVDRHGNAVANTYTLNLGYGARVAVPEVGVLLNNEMDDFTTTPGEPNAFGLVQGAVNAIAPNKRMLSSMTPTIVRKRGKVRLAIGAVGGSLIIAAIAQTLLAHLGDGQPLAEAINAPRLRHQWWPDAVLADPGVPETLKTKLAARGYTFEEPWWWMYNRCHAVEVDPVSDKRRAVTDVNRNIGYAAAY